ncbi:hypothetical protein Tco_0453961 [Tanacetum coccineum]
MIQFILLVGKARIEWSSNTRLYHGIPTILVIITGILSHWPWLKIGYGITDAFGYVVTMTWQVYGVTDVFGYGITDVVMSISIHAPDVMDDVIQPLIPQTLHTTPLGKDYLAPATKSILDELLEQFGDKILDITMVDEEADFNPTRDIEELEHLITDIESSFFTEIKVLSCIMETNVEHEAFIRQMTPLYRLSQLAKPSTKTETLTRLHSSTRATEWFKRLVAYAKCIRDSYETIQVDARGVVLGSLLAARKNFKPD